MLKRVLFLIAFSSLIWTSCTKENNAPAIDLQPEFYPLNVGAVYIYDVDSTAYSNFTGGKVQYQFQLKDSVADTFTDLTGQVNYRIERYKRNTVNDAWKIQQVYSRNKSIRAAEEFINNQRFIRLVFPPLRGSEWNGNSKNTLDKQEYTIEDDISPLTVNTLNFDSTVTVKEIDEFNLIKEDLVKSTYAKNVGLVQKTVTDIEKNISTGVITNGRIYSYKLSAYKQP
ncbi:hypothetical protein [Pedobacter arcticus]|uniref:hypothetical protein n=1 Tax=Pedobacter arcticus TaxID=752140 RepID=UPI0002FE334D|nr:hypothetical protein [Pedobacter arcticus]